MVHKKSFWRKIFSGMSILSILVNSVLPYGLLTTVYAQESTTSATQQLASPTPIETRSPTPTDTPIPTPTDTPTPTPTSTPTPPAEQDLASLDTTIATPSATPNPTLTITPEPTPEATPSATPTPVEGQILDGVSTESAGLKQGNVLPRKAGDLMKKPKQQANQDYVEGEVIVKFKKNKLDIKSFFGKARAFVFEKRHSLEKRDEMKTSNTQVFKSKKSTDDMVKELKSDANVEYAEPNYRRDLTTILSNDTYKDTLWGLDNIGQSVEGSTGTIDADIDAPEAWNISESSSSVIVAIIDTGVAYNHPDLQANMWDGSNCKDENGLALNNCNHGYDFEDNDKTPLPDWSSHGTHVAGIIAAAKNNAKGIIGVAPTTKIMALKFGLTVATEVKAIDFAIQNGAKVINASFGGGPYSQSEYDAINRFKTAGGIYVAAAGNNSNNNDDSHFYPSDYDLDNIISVAATDNNDEPAVFTNYGATSVDVGAPGVDIYSTIVDIQVPVVLNESFESYTPPAIPNNWEKTGNWGTFNTEDEFWGNVLYGDLNRPYTNSTNSTITSPTYNVSGASGNIGFFAVCDTQYNTDGWYDYMALEISGNGTDFNEILRWDEASMDNDTDESNNENGKTINYLYSSIPSNLLTDNFKFRLRWITDAEGTGTTGDGCHVDDIYISKYVVDSSEKYEYYSGTSMAAPHVVGLTALIEGYNSSLTAAQVKNIILSTGDSLPYLVGNTVSGKRINAYQALLASAPLSSAKVITSFTVPGQTGSTVINESAHTIGITVPFGTDVTALVPTITTTGVSVSPASGVAQNFTNPVPYIVIAPDSSTQAYTVTVIVSDDPIATAFDGISAMLAGSPNNVANNLNNVTTANISNFSGLYFEKFINGIPVGKLTFNGPLNLSNNETKTFLQNLGTKLEQGEGRIALDARESAVFIAAGASLVMYDMPRITYSQLIVRDDTDTILNSTDIIESFTQNPTTGDIFFDTAHFTQFDIDTTKPVIAAHANVGPFEATSGSGAIATYTSPNATDNIDPDGPASCFPVSGSTFALGSTTVTCNKTDTAGNSATPTTFTVSVSDTTVPSGSITAPADNSSYNVIPTFTASASDNTAISSVKFQYKENSDSSFIDLNTDTQFAYAADWTGVTLTTNTIYNLQIVILDSAGNTSTVSGVSFTYDTTAINAPSTPDLSASDDTGSSSIDNLTKNVDNLTFSGTSEANSTVELFDGLTSKGTTITAVNGTWSKDVSLVAGVHSMSAKATDPAGNVSDSSVILSVTVDTAAPVFDAGNVTRTTTTIETDFTEELDTQTVNAEDFSVAGNTVIGVEVLNNITRVMLTLATPIATDSRPDITTALHSFTDLAGNPVDQATRTPLDGIAPVISEVTPISTLANDPTPDYTFTSSETGTITFGGGCAANTTASKGNNTKTLNSLADGTYSGCTLLVTDTSGNQSSLLNISSFTVDTGAPDAPTITSVATDNKINNSEKSAIVITGFATANISLSVRLTDSVTTTKTNTGTADGSGNYSIIIDGTTGTDLIDGTINVSVTATDDAGNTNSTILNITQDTAKPVITSYNDITAEATSGSGAAVMYIPPTATDYFDATADANCTPVSGSTFSIGTTTVTCTKTDAAGNAATPTTFTVTVTANTPPSFDPIANQTVNEDAVSQNVSITNISPGPAGESSQMVTLTATSSDTTVVPNPTISGSGATRTLSFAPGANKYGSVTITVTANDGQTLFNAYSRTFTITINPVNDAPVATDDTAIVDEDTTLIITKSVLLSNDTNVDGDTLTLTAVSNPTHGTVAVLGSTVVFTPTSDYFGTAGFDYTVSDGSLSDTGTVLVTINSVNDKPVAVNGTSTTAQGVTKTITLSASDIDVPVQTFTYSIVANPIHGTLGVISGNQVTYTSNANYSGSDSFTFKANDGTDDSNAATVTITIQDVTSPTVTKLGDNSIDVTLPIGSTNLVFSEMLSTDSKIVVQNALTAGADKALSFSWTGGVVAITATETTTFANDVVVNISDVAGNTATGLLLVDSSLTAVQTTPSLSGAATVDATTPQVVITNPSQAVEVTISTGTTNPTINVSSFVNDGTGDIPQITINSDTADIAIPATTVTGPGDWNGVIAAPTVTTVTLPETSGETKTFSAGIEIGFADGKLSFDEAVRMLLPGQAGKRAGYSRPGTAFTEITGVCAADNQITGNALGVDGDCKIDSGLDLVIWTKHFTKFASYTQTTNSTSSSSSSNSSSNSSSGGSVSAPVCNDTKPGSAPTLTGVNTGTNSVTLTWSAAKNPVSYYLITYGLTSGSQTWGNPNVGGSGTTRYTINGLSGATKYYFKVRAGNGCAPGDYSNELSATPGGEFISSPATGFSEGVLGATTSTKSTEPSFNETSTLIYPTPNEGQVLGVQQSFDWKKWLSWGTIFILPFIFIIAFLKKRNQ